MIKLFKIYFSFMFIFLSIGQMYTQSLHPISNYYDENEYSLLREYFDFIKLPNTFNDREQLNVNAEYIMGMLNKAGIEGKLLYDKDKKSVPAVYGEVIHSPTAKTIVFYAHYDGQPVNPANWYSGLEPFTPQLLTDRLDKGGKFIDFPKVDEKFDPKWRIYGRASADDKAGVFSIIKAWQAIKDKGLKPEINIKFFFEGEEENGSVNLEGILENNKETLKGDFWVICDGPMPASGQKQITFGVRGDVNMHLTVYGPKRPLHSGNYGNWAPNPAHKLVRLLASMKDDNGKILIDGYYDDVIPLTATEKKALADIDDPGPFLQGELGFATAETTNLSFLESIVSVPTLNINGISAANVGKLSANVIPTTASAALDLRLVKGNTVEKQTARVLAHIRKMGFHVVTREPTDEERSKYKNLIFVTQGHGYPAQRTPMDDATAIKIATAVQSTSDKKVVLMPSAGGSLPLYLFEKVTRTYPVTIPIVNYDNNQHAENENLEIGRLSEGMKTLAAIMLFKY